MAPAARVLAAFLAVALPTSLTAAKDANTIVYAAFGDWGWSPTGASRLSGSPLCSLLSGTCGRLAALHSRETPPLHLTRPASTPTPPGANNSILTNALSATCKNYTLANYQSNPSSFTCAPSPPTGAQHSLPPR